MRNYIIPNLIELVFKKYRNHKLYFKEKSLINNSVFFSDYLKNSILGPFEKDNVIKITTSDNDLNYFRLTNSLNKSKNFCNENFNKMYKRALFFTNISQQLVLEGKTKEFSHLRIDYE